MKIKIESGAETLRELQIEQTGVAVIPVENDTAEERNRRVSFDLPIIDIQSLWAPNCSSIIAKVPFSPTTITSHASYLFPYVCFMNLEQRNICSVYTDLWQDDTQIITRPNQETACFRVEVEIMLPPGAKGSVHLDFRNIPWQDALAGCRALLYAGKKPAYPAGAWDPVYCTWYAVHAAVDQAWIDANAPLAAELGFRTFIVDDGWCFDEKKRVSPETIKNWYENIGNWTLSKVKFPSFAEHRERIRKLGINYMFWVTPFLIGQKADFLKTYPGCTQVSFREGCSDLNMYHFEAGEEIKRRLVAVMKDLDLDGLKIDFLDTVRPNMEKPVGRRLAAYIQDLTDQLKAIRKDALIEFRQSYATPGMACCGTQFRAGDVPFDFIENFKRLCNIRLCMGDGIPVHADPMYWNENDKPENISRHLIACMAGVPMLSMELTTMPPHIRKILCRWLKFYEEHRDTLNFGTWKILFGNEAVSCAVATQGSERIIITRDAVPHPGALADFSGTCHILNLAGGDIVLPGAKVIDCFGDEKTGGVIPAGAEGIMTLP